MTLSLRTRLFLAQTLVTVAVLAIVTTLAILEQRRWATGWHVGALERAARAAERDLAAPPADTAAAPLDSSKRAAALGRLLDLRVTLIDSLGRVGGDSEVARERLPEVENHSSRPEVAAALGGRTGHSTRFSRTVGRELL